MTKLDCLKSEYWKDLEEIILFGCGRQGWKIYQTLSKEFKIVEVVDNKKTGEFGKYHIRKIEEITHLLKKVKIIVTTSQYYYQDIKKQLEALGLREYVDFVMYQQFVTEWFYKYKGRINVLKTDISLTTKCTLNCEHCMQFLPYWKETKENSLEEIKDNIDIYFKCVDYLLDLDIVGGEPFLYSKMEDFITYLGENYRDRIGYIGFITNGTIVPKDEVLRLIAKYNFEVSITDYSENIDYRHRIPEFIKKLEEYGISYMRNINIDWFDFGFPKDKYHYEGIDAIKHMQNCNTICHVLDDKRLFYCGQQWAAQKSKLFHDEEIGSIRLNDLIDKDIIEKKQILELIMGNIPGGHLEFCKICGGFGTDNNNKVKTAKQLRRVNI